MAEEVDYRCLSLCTSKVLILHTRAQLKKKINKSEKGEVLLVFSDKSVWMNLMLSPFAHNVTEHITYCCIQYKKFIIKKY